MGHIKEPEGIDFIVDSTPLTEADRKRISEIIAHYKATGEIIKFEKVKPREQRTSRTKIVKRKIAIRKKRQIA